MSLWMGMGLAVYRVLHTTPAKALVLLQAGTLCVQAEQEWHW